MALESHSQKKWFTEDMYGMIVLPKEVLQLQLQLSPLPMKKPLTTELKFPLPDLGRAIQDFIKTREVAEFLSGAMAGAMTKTIIAPLETIRTRMVVGVGSKNISGSFIQIVEQGGWQGLWAGNAINTLRIIPTQAIELGTYEYVKRAMTAAKEKWDNNEGPTLQIGNLCIGFSLSWLSPLAVAGAAAGIVSTLACHPLEVVKDRLTVSPEMYPNLHVAVLKIYKDGGIGALYSGIAPTLIGMLPYSTCYYFMYEKMKMSYCSAKKKDSLTRVEMLLLGALSGIVLSNFLVTAYFGFVVRPSCGFVVRPSKGWLCGYFIAATRCFSHLCWVARKRLMVGALQGKCPPNMAAAISEVIQQEGLVGLYRGWAASCLKVMPSSGITWMLYEAWKDLLLNEKRQS